MHFHQEGITKLYPTKLYVFNSVFEVRKTLPDRWINVGKNKDVKTAWFVLRTAKNSDFIDMHVRYREKLSGARELLGMIREVEQIAEEIINHTHSSIF